MNSILKILQYSSFRGINLRNRMLIAALFSLYINTFSQNYISKDSQKSSLDWSVSSTWNGGIVPSVNLTAGNVTIKGYVTLNSNLTLNGGYLYVQDTLVITGDLYMPNADQVSLQVAAQGVLIIIGDYSSKNKVLVDNGGTIVIGGTINSNGSKADYTGESGSSIYAVGGGSAYGMPTCTTPGPNCIGTGTQLSQTPVGQFYSSLTSGYSISVNSTCYTNTGTPVSLAYSPVPPANGAISNIKWFRDGTQFGGNTSSVTNWSAGNYSSSYTLNSDGKTYWAKGISVLGATGAISGNISVLAGSSNTYSVGSVTNATYYEWTVPSGSIITSGQGATSISVTAGTQVGNIVVTPKNGSSSGCSSSLMVNIKDPTCDCSTTGAYWSKNNHAGLWSDPNTWGNNNTSWTPVPPPTDGTSTGSSQSVCISGYVTITGNYKVSGSNQYICDTLVITGDFLAQNPNMTIGPNGVLIVLGNYTGTSGNITNNGRVVFVGELSQPYNFSGTGTYYSFDPTPTVPSYFSTTLYNQSQLQTNDPSLYSFYVSIACGSGISGGFIGTNQSICAGTDVAAFTSIADASPAGGISYQWYYSVNSSNPSAGSWNLISAATGNTYDSGILSQTTYFYRKAVKGSGCSANSNVITITVNKVPVTGPVYRRANDSAGLFKMRFAPVAKLQERQSIIDNYF